MVRHLGTTSEGPGHGIPGSCPVMAGDRLSDVDVTFTRDRNVFRLHHPVLIRDAQRRQNDLAHVPYELVLRRFEKPSLPEGIGRAFRLFRFRRSGPIRRRPARNVARFRRPVAFCFDVVSGSADAGARAATQRSSMPPAHPRRVRRPPAGSLPRLARRAAGRGGGVRDRRHRRHLARQGDALRQVHPRGPDVPADLGLPPDDRRRLRRHGRSPTSGPSPTWC